MGHDHLEMLQRDTAGDRSVHEGRSLKALPIVTIRPCLARLGDTLYIVAGSLRIPVPSGTRFDDIGNYVEHRSPLRYSEPLPILNPPPPAQVRSPEPDIRLVRGSSGEVYEVVTFDGKVTCTCMGFKYRGDCKHLSIRH